MSHSTVSTYDNDPSQWGWADKEYCKIFEETRESMAAVWGPWTQESRDKLHRIYREAIQRVLDLPVHKNEHFDLALGQLRSDHTYRYYQHETAFAQKRQGVWHIYRRCPRHKSVELVMTEEINALIGWSKNGVVITATQLKEMKKA